MTESRISKLKKKKIQKQKPLLVILSPVWVFFPPSAADTLACGWTSLCTWAGAVRVTPSTTAACLRRATSGCWSWRPGPSGDLTLAPDLRCEKAVWWSEKIGFVNWKSNIGRICRIQDIKCDANAKKRTSYVLHAYLD